MGYTDVTWGTLSSGTWVNNGPLTYISSPTGAWEGYNSGQNTCNAQTGIFNDMKLGSPGMPDYWAIGYTQNINSGPSSNNPGIFISGQNAAHATFYYNGSTIVMSNSDYDADTVFRLVITTDTKVYKDDVLIHTQAATLTGDSKAFCTVDRINHNLSAEVQSIAAPSGSGTRLPPPPIRLTL